MNKDWNWGNIIGSMSVVVAIALIGVGFFALIQDHSVKFYFMSGSGSNQGRNGYCIEGYRDWWTNEYGVFCSDDVNKSIVVLKEMNQALVKK